MAKVDRRDERASRNHVPEREKLKAHRGKTWFFVFVALAAGFVAADTFLTARFLEAVRQVRTSDVPPGSQPVAPNARQRSIIFPAGSVDAQWWVIHTEEALHRGAWRMRETKLDNAPMGREVHWSSPVIWLLAGLAGLRSVFTGAPALQEVAGAALWAGPVTLVLCSAAFASLVQRRFGWALAGWSVLVMVTAYPIYETFRFGEVDHHGLVSVTLAASLLCLVAGGAGVNASPSARRWFVAAGVFGSAAMWLSAASAIPVIAACAAGGVVASLVGRPSGHSERSRTSEAKVCAVGGPREKARRDENTPELWRIWGWAGCLGSLAFYLVEYFPTHLGWRLEVNHPLYAFAWLAGSDLLARICQKIGGGRFVQADASDRARFLGGLVVMALPACLIAFRPQNVFWVADKFLLTLHQEHIKEFRPMLETLGESGYLPNYLMYLLWPALATACLLAVLMRGKVSRDWHPLLACAFTAAALIQIEAFVQMRWSCVAMSLWLVLVVLLAAIYREERLAASFPRMLSACFAAVTAVALFIFPIFPIGTLLLGTKNLAANLPQAVAPKILLRDVAHRLIQASPERLPVVLSDPNSSTALAYFGGIPTLGTLYWENLPGLRSAAAIFSAPSEAQARDLLEKAGITHLIVPRWDDFSGAYVRLPRMSDSTKVRASPSFLQKVIAGEECPVWLRPFYYPIPAAFGLKGERIGVWEVRPDQTPAESLFHRGVYHGQAGEFSAAAELLRQAQSLNPADAETARWLEIVTKASAK